MEWKGLALAVIVAGMIAIIGPVWSVSLGFMEIPVVAVIVAGIILLISQAYFVGKGEESLEDDELNDDELDMEDIDI